MRRASDGGVWIWRAWRKGVLEQNTLDGIKMRMPKHLFPWLGSRPIAQIEAPALLEVLRRAEAQELGETPRRLRQYCGQIFRYAIATGRANRSLYAMAVRSGR